MESFGSGRLNTLEMCTWAIYIPSSAKINVKISASVSDRELFVIWVCTSEMEIDIPDVPNKVSVFDQQYSESLQFVFKCSILIFFSFLMKHTLT